jgi:hypothetical protein
MRPKISVDDDANALVALARVLFAMVVVLLVDLGERILE